MKNILSAILLVLLALLLWSPWITEDYVLSKARAIDGIMLERSQKWDGCNSLASNGWYISWRPFGKKYESCSWKNEYWGHYFTFWGGKF